MKKNHLTTLIILCSALALTACTSDNKSNPTRTSIGGSSDFFSITAAELSEEEQNWERPTDCKKNISKVLCEVTPSDDWTKVLSRPCLGGENQYQVQLENIYDAMDPVNQKMFCSLRRIFIERDFYATAYASLVFTPDGEDVLPGAIIGIRKSMLTNTPSFTDWATWKEQKNFIRNDVEFEAPLKYPYYQADTEISILQNTIVHEFGHLFDFSNRLNRLTTTDFDCIDKAADENQDPYEVCKFYSAAGTWGALSWESRVTALPEADFFGRKNFCFYNCTDYDVTESEMESMYIGLSNSSFISSYASTNNAEDFAESWSARWLFETKKADITLVASDTFRFKMSDIYNAQTYKAKKDFIEKTYQEELEYP